MQLDKKVSGDLIVSNARHWEALREADLYLEKVLQGLEQKISGEFISVDMRAALQALGSITGQVSNEDVLSSVFSRFCIGK
jgi:tRNA modification GTPase